MKNKYTRKLMTVLLAFTMLFGCFTETVKAETTSSTWEKATDIDAAIRSGKSIAITMTKGSTTYILPTAKLLLMTAG